MPVDPQVQRLIDIRNKLPPLHTLSVADARALMAARDIRGVRKPEVAAVAERTMPGPGGPLLLRVYTPPGTGPFPLIVFFHGSGFVVCSLDTHDAICRNLCVDSAAVVVSVDYRLAPEHKFPAAPDDCLAATRWVAEHAESLGGDAGRMVVAGDSAGGNLAAVTALRARDEGGPALRGQVLLYPVTDYYDADSPSMSENAEGYGLTRAGMQWYWDHYVSGPTEGAHPYASPLRAPDLRGLPPALVYTAEYDPLRDEGELYALALARAAVPVTVQRWHGMNHGFCFFPGLVDGASRAMARTSAWIRGVVG